MYRVSVSWLRPLLAVTLLAALSPTARSADDEVPADQALLVVRLPANATLTVGSDVSRQTGTERRFISPPLAANKSYTYELKATWTEGGKSRTVTHEVTVRAGKRTEVDLNAIAALQAKGSAQASSPKTRTFLFTYAATIKGLKPGEKAHIWLPVPPTNEDQDVKLDSQDLPGEPKEGRDPLYGNTILYLEAAPGKDGMVTLSRTYRVTRREVRGASGKDDQALVKRFLEADRLVPLEGKPLELIKDKKLPSDATEAARVMYDAVNRHMRYSKEGKGWGRGDAVWACDSKYGNCTDFHSLFISLARANHIPAKFEIGFPLPPKRGAGEVPGYHCWAKFRPDGKGWVPVDISEANKDPKMTEYYFGNLTEDRVTFSTGRDITLVPKQAAEPLNFLVYPYVEVGGEPYPAEMVQRKFSYQDLQ